MTALKSIALGLLLTLTAAALGQNDPPLKNKATVRLAGKKQVEIEVTSARPFPVINAVTVLFIGNETTHLSRSTADNGTMVFTMPAEQFARTKQGDAIIVRYDPDSQGTWEFGPLDKKAVK